MPRVAVTADGFPSPFQAINGRSDVDLPWPLLVWSAITVGRAELLHVLRHGEFSLFEIAYRAAILYANLCDTTDERVRRSEAYDGLDPTEKGAISYFLGLTMAKAISERLLAVPWLMHLDVYRQQLAPILQGSRSRPDLVGQTTAGEWIAIESKGRTRNLDREALERAKEQAGTLETVQGQAPVLRVGMVAHFGDGALQVAARDPPAEANRHSVRLPLSRPDFLKAYYRPFEAWLESEREVREVTREGVSFRVATVPAVDVSVGLALDAIPDSPESLEDRERLRSESKTHYAGRDGVLVEVGSLWSSENMAREPQERRRGA